MNASDACAAAAQFRDQRTFGYDASIRLVNSKGQAVLEKVDDLWEVQWELLFSAQQQESLAPLRESKGGSRVAVILGAGPVVVGAGEAANGRAPQTPYQHGSESFTAGGSGRADALDVAHAALIPAPNGSPACFQRGGIDSNYGQGQSE